MKVTLLSSVPPQKGITPYTLGLAGALARQPEVDVELLGYRSLYPGFLYPGGDVEDAAAGDETPSSVSVSRIMNWWDPVSWVRAGRGATGDVVHAQWWSYPLAPSYAVMLAAAKRRGKRVVMTLHNVLPHERSLWKDFLNRMVIRVADHLIVHSRRMRDVLVEEMRFAESEVSVIPHGVLVPPGPTLGREEAKERLGLAPDAKVVLYFGHIRKYKGIRTLLDAFRTVADEAPSAHLVIAGQPWVDWAPYEARIAVLKLTDRVTTKLGFVASADVGAYFAAADVIALPYSHFEAQSGIGAMALAYERAVVVSDVGGLPDVVSDPRAIVPPRDVGSLGRALTAILTDEPLREKLEQDARELSKEFEWGPIAERTVAVYRSVLEV
ncbi:MAG: glycosyltransferase family 4 protein [Chloroflexi bacterium]|nr:glycosyltransferase family 4 protein [Chloroflexota bacterium]